MGFFNNLKKTTKKYQSFMNTEVNKKGFNRVYFNLTARRKFSYLLLEKIILKLFKKFRKGSSFNLIAKFKFTDNSYRTLHKGIVIQRQMNEDYLIFLKNRIEDKGGSYNEDSIKQIIFEYNFIPKKDLSNFPLSWPELASDIIDENINKYIPKDESGNTQKELFSIEQ